MEGEGSRALFSTRLTSPGTWLHITEPRNQNKVTLFPSTNMVREETGPSPPEQRVGYSGGEGWAHHSPPNRKPGWEGAQLRGRTLCWGWGWTRAHTHTPPYTSCVTRGKAWSFPDEDPWDVRWTKTDVDVSMGPTCGDSSKSHDRVGILINWEGRIA